MDSDRLGCDASRPRVSCTDRCRERQQIASTSGWPICRDGMQQLQHSLHYTLRRGDLICALVCKGDMKARRTVYHFGSHGVAAGCRAEVQRAAAVNDDRKLWSKLRGQVPFDQAFAQTVSYTADIDYLVWVESCERTCQHTPVRRIGNVECLNRRGKCGCRSLRESAHLKAAARRDLHDSVAVRLRGRAQRREALERDGARDRQPRE